MDILKNRYNGQWKGKQLNKIRIRILLIYLK